VNCTISHNTSAPETMRMVVKLAASIAGALSAARHNSELPAKAIMASTVKTAVRAIDISRLHG